MASYICPLRPEPCMSSAACFASICVRSRHNCPPLQHVMSELAAARPALHFVGFTGEEWWSAVRVWGLPDIVHRVWDHRARAEIVPGDVAVFAKYSPDDVPSEFSWNDSERF